MREETWWIDSGNFRPFWVYIAAVVAVVSLSLSKPSCGDPLQNNSLDNSPAAENILPWSARGISEVFLELYRYQGAVVTLFSSTDDEICIVINVVFQNRSQTVRLCIVDQDFLNAFAYPEDMQDYFRIVVSRKLLSRLKTKSQLAFVLAHECSHIVNDHFVPSLDNTLLTKAQKERIRKTVVQWEIDADRYAKRQLQQAGFDERAAPNLLRTLSPKEDAAEQTLHPTLSTRLALLEQGN